MKINFEKMAKTSHAPCFKDVKLGEIFIGPETVNDERPSFWVKYCDNFAVCLSDGGVYGWTHDEEITPLKTVTLKYELA